MVSVSGGRFVLQVCRLPWPRVVKEPAEESLRGSGNDHNSLSPFSTFISFSALLHPFCLIYYEEKLRLKPDTYWKDTHYSGDKTFYRLSLTLVPGISASSCRRKSSDGVLPYPVAKDFSWFFSSSFSHIGFLYSWYPLDKRHPGVFLVRYDHLPVKYKIQLFILTKLIIVSVSQGV